MGLLLEENKKRFRFLSFVFLDFMYNRRMNKVNVKCLASSGAILPQYKTKGAAGADLCAFLSQPVTIKKGSTALIGTGLFFSIPDGYEIQVRPRSGLAAKNGVTVLNTPGTIDSDYRGEVKVILINLGNEDFQVKNGDRIAQMVLSPVTVGDFELVSSLDETERGAGGFGSTGK